MQFSPTNSIDLDAITINLGSRLSVRLYRDCRPNCLETAALQKGLVLLLDGQEVIEEGLGFGVPVVKYTDKTFFCGRAEVSIKNDGSVNTLTKTYTLDTVSLKKIGQATYIDDSVYSLVRKIFERLYLRMKILNFLFRKFMEIRRLANIKTEFVTVKPRGTVTVNYQCSPAVINIQVDFSKVVLKKCNELLVLNEQGSCIFNKYKDTSGTALVGGRIGAWDAVKADQAYLQTAKGRVSFSARKIKGAILFRGWEQTKNRFSWAGLSYSIPPRKSVFKYSIVLDCAAN